MIPAVNIRGGFTMKKILIFLFILFGSLSTTGPALAGHQKQWDNFGVSVDALGNTLTTSIYGYYVDVAGCGQVFIVCDPVTGQEVGQAYVSGAIIGQRQVPVIEKVEEFKDITVNPVVLVSGDEGYIADKQLFCRVTNVETQDVTYPYSTAAVPDLWRYMYFHYVNPNDFPVKANINLVTIFGPSNAQINDVYFNANEDKWIRFNISSVYSNLKKFAIESQPTVTMADIEGTTNNFSTSGWDRAFQWFNFSWLNISPNAESSASDKQNIWVLRPCFKEVWSWVPEAGYGGNVGTVNKTLTPAYQWVKMTANLNGFMNGSLSDEFGTEEDVANHRAVKTYYLYQRPLSLVEKKVFERSQQVQVVNYLAQYGFNFTDICTHGYLSSTVGNHVVYLEYPLRFDDPWVIWLFSVAGEYEKFYSADPNSNDASSLKSRLLGIQAVRSDGTVLSSKYGNYKQSYGVYLYSMPKDQYETDYDFPSEIRKLTGSIVYNEGVLTKARVVFKNIMDYPVKLSSVYPLALYRDDGDVVYGGLSGGYDIPFLNPGESYEKLLDADDVNFPQAPLLFIEGGQAMVTLGGSAIAGIPSQVNWKFWSGAFTPNLASEMFDDEEMMTPSELALFANAHTNVRNNITAFLANNPYGVNVTAKYLYNPN